MKAVAEEFLRAGSTCYLYVSTEDGRIVVASRIYSDSPLEEPVCAVARRDIQRGEVVEFEPDRDTPDFELPPP